MYTNSCYIRKNTPDLRKKLEELGYRVCICTELSDTKWLYTSNNPNLAFNVHGIGYTSEEEFPGATSEIFLAKFEQSAKEKNIIDCSTNEELFLAIAALRDDTWLNQWIIVPKIEIRRLSGYFGQTCGMDGHYMKVVGYDWIICNEQNLHNKVQLYIDDGEDPKTLPRKASIDELIEHFKEK